MIRDLNRANDFVDLIESLKRRRKSSMHAHDFLVNDSANRHTVKAVRKYFPDLWVVTSLTLIIETIQSID